MDVSGELYTLPALLPRRRPWFPLWTKSWVPQVLSDHLTAKENLLPLQVIKTLFLSHAAYSLVTLLTEQFWVTGRSLQI